MVLSSALPLAEPTRAPPATDLGDFRQIYDEHLAVVWRTLRRYGVPERSLDDAVQDVFTVVHTKLSGFEGRSTLKTWIFGITRRVARNHRDRAREQLGDGHIERLADRKLSHPARTEQLEKARLLSRLLDDLSPEQRELFILVEVEELTVREAAEALDENENTLASRLRRAREDLKENLARVTARDDWRAGCAT
jgi:RNA polymerase sigma-70 factor (ECF subfamily)